MTGQQFSEVDFDLLADYVGGALDGTPEEATVARRVAEEPAWSEAHAALVEATGSVRTSLASWGESAEPMPAEVADRITAALQDEPHRPALSLVPDDQDGPRRSVTRPRRRLPAWAGPAAIAASIAAIAGFGLSQATSGGDDAGSAETAANAPASARDNSDTSGGSAPYAAVVLAASGTDYEGATLVSASPPVGLLSVPPAATKAQQEDRQDFDSPPGLERLEAPTAVDACVAAIAQDHPQSVTTVEIVDLATYEGSPAAVVFFVDRSGARWVWAAGPDCGLAGRGADTRGSAQIG